MAPRQAFDRIALTTLCLVLYLMSVRCASFDCSLSILSDTGVVKGSRVDLECVVTPGTAKSQPGEEPVVLYDAALKVDTVTGDSLPRCARHCKR